MAIDPITAALDIGNSLIERLWPDPNIAASEKRKLAEIAQRGDMAELQGKIQIMLAQIEVNKIEAKSKSLFVAGWRPAVGWTGVIALAAAYIPKALVLTIMWTWQCVMVLKGWDGNGVLTLPVYPDMGVGDILGLLGSILGVGGMRSYDKGKGTSTEKIN